MTRILGDYNILKLIGQGSLGSVYLAEHRFMKKHYVLKVLPEELATDRGFIQRFEEEVSRLAVLEHPNIVKIHNISFAQGAYFLVTDCVVDPLGETTNLTQYLASHSAPFEEKQLVDFVGQIAEALDFAHSQNRGREPVVHRGLKLNNILIGQKNGKIMPVISDFGLSRVVGMGNVMSRINRTLAQALDITPVIEGSKGHPDKYPSQAVDSQKLAMLHNSFLQNYAFLAPEQKKMGVGTRIDEKVDVYAFGLLVYFLITREFPEGIFDLPSVRIPTLSMDWDSVVTSCLQMDPTKRPEKLVALLDQFLREKKKETVTKATDYPENYLTGIQGNIPQPLSSFTANKAAAPFTAEAPQNPLPLSTPQPVGAMAVPTAATMMRPEPVATAAAPAPVVAQPAAAETPSTFLKPAAASEPSPKPILQGQTLERPTYDPDPAQALKVDSTVKQYQPEPSEENNIEPLQTDMIVVKGGDYMRGSDEGNRDEMPRHQIGIQSFAIDIYPVTNEQFVRFLAVMGGEKDSNNNDIIRLRESRIKRSGGKLSIESGYSKHPVVGVTWYGAVAYAKWVGKRLPTEAEWEIACRGEQLNAPFPTGEDVEKSQANFFSSDTIAVMSYAPNSIGLYDMIGNVYEWCQDWYGYNYYEVSAQEPDNPRGPLQGVYRVLRGGCWKSLKEDMRSSHRHRNNPGTFNRTYGFRCVTDVQ